MPCVESDQWSIQLSIVDWQWLSQVPCGVFPHVSYVTGGLLIGDSKVGTWDFLHAKYGLCQ